MAEWHVELRLPLLSIGADKINLELPGRRAREVGPVQIISRNRNTALDTGRKSGDGVNTEMWPPHAEVQQLWRLFPTGKAGLVQIISLENGKALDATPLEHGDIKLRMAKPSNAEWQQWRIEGAPDKVGVTISTTYTRRRQYLAVSHDAQPDWGTWFDENTGNRYVEWIISQPIQP